MSPKIYDVIVVGGGAVGLGATYELAKSGASVLVLEQNNFYNQAGSSGDLPRMYRTMYTEDFMADMAKDSLKIWKALERDAGTSLRSMSGLLNFGDPSLGQGTPEGTLLGPIANLERLKMPYTRLDKDEIEHQYPFKNLRSDYEGVFAPDNGVINVPLMLRTLFRLARDYGADAHQNIEVKKLEPEKDDDATGSEEDDSKKIWRVNAVQHGKDDVYFRGRKIIVTAGAYTNHVLDPSFKLRLKLDIWEMTASYFGMNAGPGGAVFPSMWFQFADDKDGRSQLFYGFPAVEWGPPNLCRIAVDAATNKITDPDQRSASVVSPEDIQDVIDFVKDHVVGVDATSPVFSSTCLMTNVFDNMFVLDYVPEKYLKGGAKKSVMVFTAGWAMKFVPLLGQALKDMALHGGSKYAREEFKITRLNKNDLDSEGKPKPGIIASASEVRSAKISSFAMSGPKGQAKGSSVHHAHIATV